MPCCLMGSCQHPLEASPKPVLRPWRAWRSQLLHTGGSAARPSLCLPSPTPISSVPLQFKEYLSRAEYIKGILDGRQPAEEAPSSSANGAAASKPKSGGGGGGGDSKQVRWTRLGAVAGCVRCCIDARMMRMAPGQGAKQRQCAVPALC